MSEDALDVDHRSPEVEEDERLHAVCRDLAAGVEVMRERARRGVYMTPNPLELELVSPQASQNYVDQQTGLHISSSSVGSQSGISGVTLYDLRVSRSDLPNPWAESIEDLAAMPFRERIDVSGYSPLLTGETVLDDDGEVVDRIPGWVDDMDGEGRSIDEWGQAGFLASLYEGVVYGLVDQDARRFDSVAARRAANARPYCRLVGRGEVRGLVVGVSKAGVPRLLYLSLVHQVTTVDLSDPGAYLVGSRDARKVYVAGDEDAERGSDEAKVRVYVYVRGKDESGVESWVEDENLRGTVEPDDPTQELRDIPLVPLYSRRVGPFRGRSPFLNTAWTQVGIWCHNSEMSGLAREASVTYVHESGVGGDDEGRPMLADTRNARYRASTDPNAKLSIEEVEGKAVRTIAMVIDRKEEAIRRAHHAMLSDKPSGPVTAREVTVEAVQASSKLESWVILHEAGWTRILDLMSLLGGIPARGSASIPHDFALPSSNMDLLKDLFKEDKVHPKNFWREAMRAGIVDEQTFDLDLEVQSFEENAEMRRKLAALGSDQGVNSEGDGAMDEEGDDGAIDDAVEDVDDQSSST